MSEITINTDVKEKADLNINVDVKDEADLNINIETWPSVDPDNPGQPGKDGKDGVGIKSILPVVVSSESGFENVYEVLMTDGSKYRLSVFNGEKGESGFSPSIVVAGETDTHIIFRITNANGPYEVELSKGKNGRDGIDGKDGRDGLDGKDGRDGKDGKDGKDGRDYTAGTIHKNERIAACNPAEGSELHVISHIRPYYYQGHKNVLPPAKWGTTWNGIAYAWNNDGSLSITGTATGGNSAYEFSEIIKPTKEQAGVYTLSLGATLPEGVYVYCEAYEDAANWVGYSGEHSFRFTCDDAYTTEITSKYEYRIGITIEEGRTVSLTIYPQIEAGEYATAFERYTDPYSNPQATSRLELTVANHEGEQKYAVNFGRDVYHAEYDWNSGKLTVLDTGAEHSYAPNKIKALPGANFIHADSGFVEVEGYTDDGHSAKMQKYMHMPRLYMYGDDTDMTKDNAVMLRFKYAGAENYINDPLESGRREDGKRRGGFIKVKWQGSSSIAFPKKNYTLSFYWDDAAEKKRDVQFRSEWGTHSKYCAKANFIDPTHCRNVVAAKLWGECVRSRNQDSESYIHMHDLPNAGAVDGYPMLVFINDKYQGIYTMNIPKDEWMFGMKDGEGTNVVLSGENYSGSTQFYEPPMVDGTDWDYEIEPADKSSVAASFGRIYTAVSMPADTDAEKAAKKAALEACVDIYSVIDYDIFLGALGLSDNNGKNQLMVTYDGVKWIMIAYDLDTAFGNSPDGTSYRPSDLEYDHDNGLMWAVRTLYADEYAARKAELEKGCLRRTNIIDKLLNFTIDIPQEAYRAEAELWPDMCGANANAMQQIIAYVNGMDGEEDTSSGLDEESLFETLNRWEAINTLVDDDGACLTDENGDILLGDDNYIPKQQESEHSTPGISKAEVNEIVNKAIEESQPGDFVIEAGKSGIWTYEKWNSGKAVCVGTLKEKRSNYTTVGPFYGYYSNQAKYPTGLFVSPPVMMHSSKVGNGFVIDAGDVQNNAAHAAAYALCTASGEVDCSWNFYCVGRWKN